MKRMTLNSNAWLEMCLAVPAVAAATEAPAPAVSTVTLDIKSQPIGTALNELAKKAGIQLLFFTDVAADLSTPALAGTFTPDEALRVLLSNTGLTYSMVNARTVGIHRVGSTVAEGKATRNEAGRRTMRLANDLQISEKPTNEAAQETGSPAEGRENSGEERRRKNSRIEEVIVTARKRTEDLQDVPISISVVTKDDIERRGLVSAEDYLRGMPGVNQITQGSNQAIIIRGLETATAGQNIGAGTTVATYFGETPTTNSAGLSGSTNIDLKLVDIERVEVLRGPQGTAFGSSSLGGAVRTIPAAPRLDQFEGRVAAGYSVTSGTGGDNYNAQVVLNVPLSTDKLAIRTVAYQYEDSGYYRNVAASDPGFQTAVVVPIGAQAFATDEEEIGLTQSTGGRIAAMFQATDALRFTLNYLHQKTEIDGQVFSNLGIYDQTSLQVLPRHIVRGQKQGVSDTKIDLANAMIEYDFGWADLLATYSYTKSEATQTTTGLQGAPAFRGLSLLIASPPRMRAAEIRLVTHLDGAWDFLGGFYTEKLEDTYFADFSWLGTPQSTTFRVGPGGVIHTQVDERETTQDAAFAEVSWDFLPSFTLTGGARAYEYERTRLLNSVGAFSNNTDVRARGDASGTSFRGNLSYKHADNAHLYVSWAEGFRLGLPIAIAFPPHCDANGDGVLDGTNATFEELSFIESDNVESYELGGKFTLFDRRLAISAAVFRMDWSDLPATLRAPAAPIGCGQTYRTNVGEARSEGVELQVNYSVTDALRVDVGGSWISGNLIGDSPGLGIPQGARLPGSPELNATVGLQYEFAVSSSKAFVRVDSIYVGSFYGDLLETRGLEAGGYVKLDASARVELRNFAIDLFVRNLTNQDDFTYSGGFGGTGVFGYRLRPRTIGVQLGYTF